MQDSNSFNGMQFSMIHFLDTTPIGKFLVDNNLLMENGATAGLVSLQKIKEHESFKLTVDRCQCGISVHHYRVPPREACGLWVVGVPGKSFSLLPVYENPDTAIHIAVGNNLPPMRYRQVIAELLAACKRGDNGTQRYYGTPKTARRRRRKNARWSRDRMHTFCGA